jgi:hypothetical protein
VTRCAGDLRVGVWDAAAIGIDTDDERAEVGREGDAVILSTRNDLELWLPAGAELRAEWVNGDVRIAGVAQAFVEMVAGDLNAADLDALTVERQVGGDVEIRRVRMAEIGAVGGNAGCESIGEALRIGSVGGDLEVHASASAVLIAESIGGDLEIVEAASARCGSVGGDAALRQIGGDAQVGDVGGDCVLEQVSGAAQVGSVGGNATFERVSGGLEVGGVGGDLKLSAPFHGVSRLVVGGDAAINLGPSPDVRISATVGGQVEGPQIVSHVHGGTISIVYGEGTNLLTLSVGGDLDVSGGGVPRASSATAGDWRDFERDMERLGAELGRMGEELGRAFAGWGAARSREWNERVRRLSQEARERAEDRVRRAAERVEASVQRQPERVRVRINDREWVFDQERLERLKEQARQAAREGVAGAIAAIDRAFAAMGMPPTPPPPPAPGEPPAPPYPATGPTMRIEMPPEAAAGRAGVEALAPTPTEPRHPDEERAAILRMIAERRITPEEGDMLLDALG